MTDSLLDLRKLRELLTSDSESDQKLGLQIMANRNHTLILRDHKPELWRNKVDVVCDHIMWMPGGWDIFPFFVEFHENASGEWWIEDMRGRVIDKNCVVDLREGFALYQDTAIHLSFWDRIRVLFGARFMVRTEHSVDKPVIVSNGNAKITIGKPKIGMSSMDMTHGKGKR